MHFYMPSLMPRPSFGRWRWWRTWRSECRQLQTDPVKEGLEQIEKLKAFFREAKAYNAAANT